MKAILKTPNMPAYCIDIDNELKAFQEIVCGYIEVVEFPYDIAMVINEEGKCLNMKINFYSNIIGGFINGNAVFVGVNEDEFCGLTEAQILFIQEKILKEN